MLSKKYGISKNGNFSVIDTVGVPHPYCITSKHLQTGRMYLGADAIREAEEKYKAVCDICRKRVKKGLQPKILTYDEHKQALLVECKKDIHDPEDKTKMNPELHEYLLGIKELAKQEKYEGFVFLDKRMDKRMDVKK